MIIPVNLREMVEADLEFSLEGEWGLPVILIDPDGNIQDKKKGAETELKGQILYNTVGLNPETGEQVVVNNPIVTLRKTSLERIPANGEKWLVRIPIVPNATADKEDFLISATKPLEGGASIGFIRLYCRRAVQV